MFYDALGIEVTLRFRLKMPRRQKQHVMGGHADVLHCYLAGAVTPTKNKDIRPLVIGAEERSEFLPMFHI
jgi:hypothetical protein